MSLAREQRLPPGRLGFRWPAEWEPHAATWLLWPHNVETWPGVLADVERAFAAMVEALCDGETVRVGVANDRVEERARSVLAAGNCDSAVEFLRIPNDDAWVRDSGPVFIVGDPSNGRERAAIGFRFDSWGGKYPPWDRDASVAPRIAELAGLRSFSCDWVLEGGAIDGNGRGSVLATEACLLHPNRSRGRDRRSRESVEAMLGDWLGARQLIWLAGGIAGDDTDGHVDDVARFIAVDTVVAAVEGDPSDANAPALRENLRRLRSVRDADGKPLNVIELPMPPARRADGVRCPASYANFYLANGVALVPVFGAASDGRALAILAECLPGRAVVPIPASELVVGLGAVHCLTQQEPI